MRNFENKSGSPEVGNLKSESWKEAVKPVCTASRPSVTEGKSDLDIKISIGCASRVSGPVTTTTVLATIDMPEFRDVNMSGINEFDSIVSDQTVDEIGFKDDVKDLGNLGITDREKPRELPHRPVVRSGRIRYVFRICAEESLHA